MIKYVENKIDIEEYNYLYDSVGWGAYDNSIVAEALKNNIYSVSVYDNDKIIGYGRIIGDKAIFLYIQDIMVAPQYQSQKIGTAIMNKLLNKIDELKKINPNIKVYLGAVKDKEPFYKKFGFITREEAGLGSAMTLRRN